MLSRRHFVAAAALLAAPFWSSPARAADEPGKGSATRVACVGDSITFGAGVKDREKNSYPVVLGRLLGEKYEVKNFGVSGATMLSAGNLPYVKQKAYTSALAFKPDILVIKLGTNDSKPDNWDKHKAEYEADYKAMIGAFRKVNPDVKVYCALPVPVYPPGAFAIRSEVVKDEIVPLVKKVAADTKSEVIDLYAALDEQPKLFPDKVHPNAEGAALIAKTVYKALTGKDAPQ
jgi:acyl-CoA thioesterase-1